MTETSDKLIELRAAEDTRMHVGGKGSGTERCWVVQARCSKGCGPKQIVGATCGMGKNVLTDAKWETLHFPRGAGGVPMGPPYAKYIHHDYLDYAAAQALRWWFIAEQGGLSFLETRLVEMEFKYTYSAEPVRAACLISSEERQDIMPDWNKPKENLAAKPKSSTTETEG